MRVALCLSTLDHPNCPPHRCRCPCCMYLSSLLWLLANGFTTMIVRLLRSPCHCSLLEPFSRTAGVALSSNNSLYLSVFHRFLGCWRKDVQLVPHRLLRCIGWPSNGGPKHLSRMKALNQPLRGNGNLLFSSQRVLPHRAPVRSCRWKARDAYMCRD
jgi:hypothetical protein